MLVIFYHKTLHGSWICHISALKSELIHLANLLPVFITLRIALDSITSYSCIELPPEASEEDREEIEEVPQMKHAYVTVTAVSFKLDGTVALKGEQRMAATQLSLARVKVFTKSNAV